MFIYLKNKKESMAKGFSRDYFESNIKGIQAARKIFTKVSDKLTIEELSLLISQSRSKASNVIPDLEKKVTALKEVGKEGVNELRAIILELDRVSANKAQPPLKEDKLKIRLHSEIREITGSLVIIETQLNNFIKKYEESIDQLLD